MRWNAIFTCATCTARWLVAGQHSSRDMAEVDGPSIPPRTLVENIPIYRGRQIKTSSVWKGNAERNNLRVCAACGEEVGQET